MARSRSERILTAEQVGGSDPTKSVVLATPGEYPEDYQEEGVVWKAGFDIAAAKGNTTKACIVFANNYQGEELSDEAIEAEIDRLQRLQEERSAG